MRVQKTSMTPCGISTTDYLLCTKCTATPSPRSQTKILRMVVGWGYSQYVTAFGSNFGGIVRGLRRGSGSEQPRRAWEAGREGDTAAQRERVGAGEPQTIVPSFAHSLVRSVVH